MRSPSARHFPPVVFQDGERYLWNSVQRKALADRPEERVRLRYLDYLLLEVSWPRTRIAIESAIKSSGKSAPLRADLVCYNREMVPSVLIECKAGSIKPGEAAAVQIARYNRTIGAEFLCITNGDVDFWFHVTEGATGAIEKPPFETTGVQPSAAAPVADTSSPDELSAVVNFSEAGEAFGHSAEEALSAEREKNFRSASSAPGYWQQRGFLGTGSAQELLVFLTELLRNYWTFDREVVPVWLSFQTVYRNVPLDHYYCLFDRQQSDRLAITFIGSADGETWLVAFLNREQVAEGYIVINLDRLFSGDSQNAERMLKGRSVQFDAGDYLHFDTFRTDQEFIEEMISKLHDMFKKETDI